MRGVLLLVSLWLWAASMVHCQTGSITLLESDKAFEHEAIGSDACWAILFISDIPNEAAQHTQMRFELASSHLSDRIKLGIVAVHDAPETAAEFLPTHETPQIGARLTESRRGTRATDARNPLAVLFKHRERYGERLAFEHPIGVRQLLQTVLAGVPHATQLPWMCAVAHRRPK